MVQHFATFGEAKSENFKWTSGEDQLQSFTAENGSIRKFCPTCGSSMIFQASIDQTDVVEFSLGTLESDIDISPDLINFLHFNKGLSLMKTSFGIACVVLALGLTACSDDKTDKASDAAKTTTNIVDKAKETTTKAVEATKETATKAVESTKEAAGSVVDKAKEVSTNAKESVSNATDNVVNKVKETVTETTEAVKEKTTETMADVKEKAVEMKTEAVEKVKEMKDGAVETAKEKVQGVVDSTKEAGSSVMEKASAMTEKAKTAVSDTTG
ncbi:hypothetical protein GQR58_006768 [Nymphon striatum]|nr:hypothetical protein GQR58_006768 [Nymphon striatum]